MTYDLSAEDAEIYSFESETALYELDAHSDKGKQFRNLSSGPDKIDFLKMNGRRTTKETGGRIMVPHKGVWRHYNDRQFEYMFEAEDGSDCGSPLEIRCQALETVEARREFIVKNATRIRRWPDRVHRVPNLG